MDVGAQALSDYIFASKYAHSVDGRRETWDEAVSRVEGMHRRHYGAKLAPIAGEVDAAFRRLRRKEVLGSQRNMQYGGVAVERKHERSYNCATTYIDRKRAFAETFFLLLCGCGVGFSVQRSHVGKLPPVLEAKDWHEPYTFVVPDTIEGWADALDTLVESYLFHGTKVQFDFSLVRPAGSALSTGTGFAPGPEPLRIALERIRAVLEGARGRHLRPIEAYDILMHAADAVLSGGVRRSATLALFSVDDEEMLVAKSGNWTETNPQRGRSNNSVLLLRDTPWDVFERFVDVARASGGEPGVVWTDSLDFVFNPCLEIGMLPQTVDGRSGVQFCNLSTVNGAACETEAQFLAACGSAALLGTLQAGYTYFPYLGPVSEEITRREALIGVSITGVQDSPAVLLDPTILRRGAEGVIAVNQRVAAALGINAAARCTALKPEGTSSALLGCASGKHRRHAQRYIRRVQANGNELPALAYRAANPTAVEASVWRDGDLSLKFPIESPSGALLRGRETAVQQLADVVRLQRFWVGYGKVEDRCADKALMNSVSNTVTVQDHEWGMAKEFIYFHRESFTGVSLLPASGDLDYEQAPFVSVDEPEREALADEWNWLRTTLSPVDYSVGSAVDFVADSACSGGACELR